MFFAQYIKYDFISFLYFSRHAQRIIIIQRIGRSEFKLIRSRIITRLNTFGITADSRENFGIDSIDICVNKHTTCVIFYHCVAVPPEYVVGSKFNDNSAQLPNCRQSHRILQDFRKSLTVGISY